MIVDYIVNVVCALLGGLIKTFLPVVSFSLPSVDLSSLGGGLAQANRLLPLETLLWVFGCVLALLLGGLIWRAVAWLWDKIPVLGHGAV